MEKMQKQIDSLVVEKEKLPTPRATYQPEMEATPEKKKWADMKDVEDNEDLCRKKSKCCCVYHKPRRPDESSGEPFELRRTRLSRFELWRKSRRNYAITGPYGQS